MYTIECINDGYMFNTDDENEAIFYSNFPRCYKVTCEGNVHQLKAA